MFTSVRIIISFYKVYLEIKSGNNQKQLKRRLSWCKMHTLSFIRLSWLSQYFSMFSIQRLLRFIINFSYVINMYKMRFKLWDMQWVSWQLLKLCLRLHFEGMELYQQLPCVIWHKTWWRLHQTDDLKIHFNWRVDK